MASPAALATLAFLVPDLSRNMVYPPWQLAGAMAAGGHRTVLMGTRSAGSWPPLGDALGDARTLNGRWGGLPSAREAVAMCRGADVAYAFKAMPTSLGVGLRVRHRLGIPLLVHLDDWDAGYFSAVGAARRAWYGLRGLGDPNGDLWLRLAERLVSRADAITVSTRTLQRRFGGTVLRQGVDTDRYGPDVFPRDEARRRVGAAEGASMVLFLGTPRLHKGLSALAAVTERGHRPWFVGTTPRALEAAGVPTEVVAHSEVRGLVPFTEAFWYLAACDVFVVPQTATPYAQHQLPAKLLQAMAMGRPIVTTDVGDAGELLLGDPAAGVVVPAGEPEAMADALEELLADKERATALGAEARRRAEADLGWRAMRRVLTGVLRDAGVDVRTGA